METTRTERNKVKQIIFRLVKAKNTCSYYGENHHLTRDAVRELYVDLVDILSDKGELILGIIANEIAYEKEPYYKTSIKVKDFIDHLTERGIKKIKFARGLKESELSGFVQLLLMNPQTADPITEIRDVIQAKKIGHIVIDDISIEEEELLLKGVTDIQALPRIAFKKGVQVMKRTVSDIRQGQGVNIALLRHVVSALVTSLLVNKNLLLMLASLRLFDDDQFVHNLTVCIFTLLQAEMLGIEKEHLTEIATASLLYNIGLLSQEDKDREDDIQATRFGQKASDIRGAKLLLKTDGISPLAAITAFETGIPYDLSGYHQRHFGNGLNLVSMMIAIASHYDQARRESAYYQETGPETVYENMLALSGKRFHPDLLNNFFSALGMYPPGTLVELDSREIALVIRASIYDVQRPQVEILYNEKGEKYRNPVNVSLLEKDHRNQYRWSIVKSIPPLDQYPLPAKYELD